MIEQIGDWIDQQTPGGYIYGASRLGKTRCIQWYLSTLLAERFCATVPLIVWNRLADSQSSEAGFWHQLLLASHFEFAHPTRPPKKIEGMFNCKERFISIAENAQRNYIALLIDEAQAMTFREWKWLTGLQNALDYEGYVLSVFSVGSHQLGYQHDYLAVTGNAHIAARFMATHARFHGLRSVKEIEFVLNGYDEDSEWPAGSGVSFLEYFAPDEFADRRRLAESAERLWQALVQLSPNAPRAHLEFPMQHVAWATEAALIRLAKGDNWEEVTSYEGWLNELAKTNFSDHMRIIGASA
jgi:hypothetical protein